MRIKDTPLYTGAAAVFPWSAKIAKAYTFTPRYGSPVDLYVNRGEEIWVPRNTAPMGEDRRDPGIPVLFQNNFGPNPKNPDPKMYADQCRVISESTRLLLEDQSHILQAPTGYGKTIVGCAIAAKIGRRTLVVTTKEDIIAQWASAAQMVLGLSADDIGVWRADSVPGANKKFVAALVQSIMKGPSRYGEAPYRGFGLVIFDEVHRMGADEFAKAAWWLNAKLRLGLSATPYRKDGKDVVFQSHIGSVRVSAEMDVLVPKVLMHKTDWQVPKRSMYGVLEKVKHEPGKTMHVEKSMVYCNSRNQWIVSLVEQALAKGRNIIVFSAMVGHLRELERLMLEAGVPQQDIGYYVGLQEYAGGKANAERQREDAKSCPVILATYAMASEATDIPWLDMCILGTPRADVVQIVGRIRRESEGKVSARSTAEGRVPVVVDLVDSDSYVFAAYAQKRERWYRLIGAPVKWV